MDILISVSIANARHGKSSLLVPDLQLGYYNSRCKELGGAAAYLAFMVKTYLPHLSRLRRQLNDFREPNWNTAYQKRGQNLLKKNFLPDARDWEAMRQAAAAYGVSICFLFTFLMRLEGENFFKKLPSEPAGERNSFPEREILAEKFRKFSKIVREYEPRTQTVKRRLQIR